MKCTFVICAYKESVFLEERILSLKKQTVRSNIFITTSTPNKYIGDIADKHGIDIIVNHGQGGITHDWNFGLSKVTQYASVAHQDDIYESEYAEKIIKEMAKSDNSIVAFSDYSEFKNGEKIHDNARVQENYIMDCKFWSKPIAKLINRFYTKPEKLNEI